MGKWEDSFLDRGYTAPEIEVIRRSRSDAGRKGGLRKGAKGLALLSLERRRAIQSMGGKAVQLNKRLRRLDYGRN